MRHAQADLLRCSTLVECLAFRQLTVYLASPFLVSSVATEGGGGRAGWAG